MVAQTVRFIWVSFFTTVITCSHASPAHHVSKCRARPQALLKACKTILQESLLLVALHLDKSVNAKHQPAHLICGEGVQA